jgi:hypothetical protein
MKKKFLIFPIAFISIFILFCKSSYGQIIDEPYDYDNNWTHVNATNQNCTSKISINSTNFPFVCYLEKLQGGDGNDTRIYRSLETTLSNTWTTEVEYKHISQGSKGSAVTVIALTAGTLPVSYKNDWKQYTGNNQLTNQDAIAVRCITEGPTDINPEFQVYIKDGTSAEQKCKVGISKNAQITYKVILQRTSQTKGSFTVYKKVENKWQVHQNTCCFDVPSTINGLSYVQTGSCCEAGYDRTSCSQLDNLKIYNDYLSTICCPSTGINGPDYVCQSTSPPYEYCVNSPSTDKSYIWSIYPSGVYFNGQNTECIQVYSWGSSQGPFIITVEEVCNCVKTILTKRVVVHGSLEPINQTFDLTTIAEGDYISKIIADGEYPILQVPSDVQEEWEIFEALDCEPLIYTFSGESLRPKDYSATYIVDGSIEPLLPTVKCYVIKRTLRYKDGSCTPVNKYMKTGTSKSENKGEFENYELSDVDIHVYPNPTYGLFEIVIPREITDIKEVEVTDSNRKILFTKEVNSSNMQLSIQIYPPGIYFLNFKGTNYQNSVQISKK